MNSRLLPVTLLFGLLLTGCATFNDSELGIIRGSGVSPRVYTKMEGGRVLTPEDVIELTRRHVPDRYILRQIDDTGVDYVVSPADLKRLRQALVSPAVQDALLTASDEFSRRYAPPRRVVYYNDPYSYRYPYAYPYAYPYGYDDGYYGPVHGSIGIGISGGHHHHGRHW